MPILKANKREELGSRKVRRLRAQGLIPAIVYGHGQQPQPVTLNEHDVELAMQRGERLLDIDIEGDRQNVLIKDMQYDIYGHTIMHVDLALVNMDERVEVSVQIVLKGTPVGVTEDGGMLQQIANEAKIECFVRSIPDQIDLAVGELKVGDHLIMSDLPLTDGAKLLEDSNAPIATVRLMAEEQEAPAEEETTAEPEIIGEKEAPEAEGQESGD